MRLFTAEGFCVIRNFSSFKKYLRYGVFQYQFIVTFRLAVTQQYINSYAVTRFTDSNTNICFNYPRDTRNKMSIETIADISHSVKSSL